MSSLWTPEGEHRVGPSAAGGQAPPGSGGGGRRGGTPQAPDHPSEETDGGTGSDHVHFEEGDDEAALSARLNELRGQLVATPVEVVVANHAYGLFELAAIHLSERPAQFEQARLAIDALGALVDGLAGRLGEAEPTLIDALAQLRLAWVQLQGGPPEDGPTGAAGA